MFSLVEMYVTDTHAISSKLKHHKTSHLKIVKIVAIAWGHLQLVSTANQNNRSRTSRTPVMVLLEGHLKAIVTLQPPSRRLIPKFSALSVACIALFSRDRIR